MEHPLKPRKVYGPYKASDGVRNIVILMLDDGRKTMSYARYRVECIMGRTLSSGEEVDHINNDPSDDRDTNFQVLTKAENIKKSHRVMEWFYFLCPACGEAARIPASQYRHNQLRYGKAGPYCSKRCAGKIHH